MKQTMSEINIKTDGKMVKALPLVSGLFTKYEYMKMRLNKHKSFLFLITLLFTMILQVNASVYDEANKLYAESNYDLALEKYMTIIQSGQESTDLYYNIGNTYFKLSDLPAAILYYEKALKLDPSNTDAVHNLELTNTMIKDKFEEIPSLFFEKWWNNLSDTMSSDQWTTLFLFLLVLTVALFVVYFISRQVRVKRFTFWSAIVALVLMLHSLGFAYQEYKQYVDQRAAIVFSPSVTVKASPSATSTSIFVIHEGAKVKLLENLNGWYKIKIPDGETGWLKKETVKEI